ncbi:MAG: CDP-alcohol phosphatidyltransferase family protein [Polyangiaceae bacterium]
MPLRHDGAVRNVAIAKAQTAGEHVREAPRLAQPTSSVSDIAVEGADALLDELSDPPNRFYRYRVARFILPLAMKTPVTPNQITALHGLTGIIAGLFIARGTKSDFIIAFILAELRMILDCLDGVVARAKNIRSPMGRTIDEFGDAVGYIGMQVGAFVYIHREHPQTNLWWVVVGSILAPAYMAVVYDFYKRKFTSALKENQDGIVDDVVKKGVHHARTGGSFVYRFGQFFDWWQIMVLSPRSRPIILSRLARELGKERKARSGDDGSEEISAIRASANTSRFRWSLRVLSWVTGDNAITVFNIGILSGMVLATEKAVILSGFSMMFLGAIVGRLFMRSAIRDLKASKQVAS